MSSPLLPTSEADPGRIYGLDNVALDLPLAGVGSRVLAGFLDYVVVGATGMGLFLLAVFSGAFVGAAFGPRWAYATFALGLVGFFIVEYGYFAGFEIATGGQTLGKKAMGLTVVTLRGARPTWGALLARNLVRTVDMLVGVPLMAIDARSRRLGDRIGGTLVVYADRVGGPAVEGLARVPEGFGPAEIATLESFLAREALLDRSVAMHIAERLTARIRHCDPSFFADAGNEADPIALLRSATSLGR